jgi:hypothetical protein
MEGEAEPARGGPIVTFPDPALVAELAVLEAAEPRAAVSIAWWKGVAWALAFALAGGALQAAVGYAAHMQLGIISIVVGVLAGIGAAKGGRSRRAQYVGAGAAAIGYFAGQHLLAIATVGWRFFELPADQLWAFEQALVKGTFSSMDALFLAIAIYQGWTIPRARP